MRHIYALCCLLLLLVLVSGCAHTPEVRITGTQEITFGYQKKLH